MSDTDMLNALEAAILRRCGTSSRSLQKMIAAFEWEMAQTTDERGKQALQRIATRLRDMLATVPQENTERYP